MSFNYSYAILKSGNQEVSIPLNRVNVFQLDMLDLVDLDIPEGFNPLKSGQCLSIKGSKEFFEKSNVSIPLNRVNVFQCR